MKEDNLENLQKIEEDCFKTEVWDKFREHFYKISLNMKNERRIENCQEIEDDIFDK